MKFSKLMTAAAFALASFQASAMVCSPGVANDCDPPVGNVIFDLAGQPIPHVYTQYTVTFTASMAVTALSFQMREDPAFFFLDDIVLRRNNAGANLVTNGDFEGGTYVGSNGQNQPNGWTYLNLYNAGASGRVQTNGPHSGTYNYYDGAVFAYDGITQNISTIVGDSYTLSFWLNDNSTQTTASRLCTNGCTPGNYGIDLLVYAGALPTLTTPEPSSVALLGLGVAGVLLARRRRRSA